MSELAPHSSSRFSDPSVASVIFAPRAQNYTLASVTFDQGVLEALGLDYWLNPEELPRQKFLTGLGWTRIEWLISEYLRNYFEGPRTGVAVTSTIQHSQGAQHIVPSRAYPFATHLDLLGGGDEGIFVDPDDFVDR